MRRADRLFEIIQILRRAGSPLTADALAAELETSRWTVYRDIAALVAQRVPIRGEAGVGYVLDAGFDLPPLMLTTDEIEAVTLGAQWVVAHGDADLARAALDVLAKVAAIVPDEMRPLIDDPALGVPPARTDLNDAPVDVARLRLWSRRGYRLSIRYADEAGVATERSIWPFMIGYVATVRVVMAWCELRQDFRLFLTDRLLSVDFVEQRYPANPATLRRRWLKQRADAHQATTVPPG